MPISESPRVWPQIAGQEALGQAGSEPRARGPMLCGSWWIRVLKRGGGGPEPQTGVIPCHKPPQPSPLLAWVFLPSGLCGQSGLWLKQALLELREAGTRGEGRAHKSLKEPAKGWGQGGLLPLEGINPLSSSEPLRLHPGLHLSIPVSEVP